MRKLLTFFLLSFVFGLQAQDYFPKDDGVHDINNNYTALTHATIYVSPNQVLTDATLLIQNGKVVSAGTSVTIPTNSVVIDLKGKSIYPSFIDLYSDFGIEKPKGQGGFGRSIQYDSKKDGYYWNEHIKPETEGYQSFKYDDKKAKELREAGFGTVLTHLQDGVARGTGALVTLNDTDNNNTRILNATAAQFFGFTRSAVSQQSYPSSQMGMTSLIRQFTYDANWYQNSKHDKRDLSIEAYLKNKNQNLDELKHELEHQAQDEWTLNLAITQISSEQKLDPTEIEIKDIVSKNPQLTQNPSLVVYLLTQQKVINYLLSLV